MLQRRVRTVTALGAAALLCLAAGCGGGTSVDSAADTTGATTSVVLSTDQAELPASAASASDRADEQGASSAAAARSSAEQEAARSAAEQAAAEAARVAAEQAAAAQPAPLAAQSVAAAPAGGAGNGCTIKGNINSKGERIYHVDGKSPSYDDTVIDESAGERWFCSEAEAQAAGWRAPKNAN